MTSGASLWIGATLSLPCDVKISYSDVEGGIASAYVDPASLLVWGDGMIESEPEFADLNAGDVHLPYTSPCRDAGDSSVVWLPEQDFDGDPRISGDGLADMGADEFHRRVYYTGTASPGEEVTVKIVGGPAKPVWLGVGPAIYEVPLETPFGPWYLDLESLIPFGLGLLPPEGMITIPYTFPVDFPAPTTLYLQAIVKDEATDPLMIRVE